MLAVNYITRPYFNDIALTLIQELKLKTRLTVIIIISPWTIDYLDIKDDSIAGHGTPFLLTDQIRNKIYQRYASYFEGATVIFKYEELKDTSIKNFLSWKKLLASNKSVLRADLNIMEVLSVSDWFFLYKIRNKKVYYILHDPVSHSGETHWRKKMVSSVYYKFIDKFLLYSFFSTELFSHNFPQFAERTVTLETPIYTNLKVPVQSKILSIEKKVLFFGRISPYKGVELFYAAAEHLSKEFKDVQFIIAGKAIGGYAPHFLSNNSNTQIKIINQFIDLDMLSELMTKSSFCVLPYLDATQSGVVMTAYAYDLPVLVSDCPGLMEYCFDPSNFSFKNGNLSDLIDKMYNLLVDESLIEENKRDIGVYAARNISEENVVKILDTYSAVPRMTGNIEAAPQRQ